MGEALFREACGQRRDQILEGASGRVAELIGGGRGLDDDGSHSATAILLYAPLRTAIVEDTDGVTWFTGDQPSTRFSSFDTAHITAVGIELDRKLAALLAVLDAPVPTALTES